MMGDKAVMGTLFSSASYEMEGDTDDVGGGTSDHLNALSDDEEGSVADLGRTSADVEGNII